MLHKNLLSFPKLDDFSCLCTSIIELKEGSVLCTSIVRNVYIWFFLFFPDCISLINYSIEQRSIRLIRTGVVIFNNGIIYSRVVVEYLLNSSLTVDVFRLLIYRPIHRPLLLEISYQITSLPEVALSYIG